MLRKHALALSLLVAAALLAPAAAAPTTPGDNGKIAFARIRFVNSPLRGEIWVSAPDGSGLHRVTHVGANYLDEHPDWAPDGSRIAFDRCAPRDGRPEQGRCTIWTVRPDGTDARQLSPCGATSTNAKACPDGTGPVYSPDGRRLAFSQYNGAPGFAIADSQLRNGRTFFPFGRAHDAPDVDALTWSPRGDELAFTVHNDNGARYKPVGGRALFMIKPDGTGLRRLTPWKLAAAGKLDWSPDGARILFRSITAEGDFPGGTVGDLYSVSPTGRALRRLTHFPAATGVELGSFSPDGTRVTLATTAGATANPIGQVYPDIATIDVRGGGLGHVTQTKNVEGSPDWGPAGR